MGHYFLQRSVSFLNSSICGPEESGESSPHFSCLNGREFTCGYYWSLCILVSDPTII